MNYLKWAEGAHNIDWFTSNGELISDNSFSVNKEGIYSLYYETINKEKRVYTFNVTKDKLPQGAWTYGFTIDESIINANSAVVYKNESTDFSPAIRKFSDTPMVSWNSWENKAPFNQIKPCVLDSTTGTVKYYLDPTDYTKKPDGTSSIIDGIDGDVMIEFPKIYWKIEKIGDVVHVNMSNEQLDSSWKCYGHMKGNTEFKNLYVSAYPVWNKGGVAMSASGVNPTGAVDERLANLRGYIQQRNSNYSFINIHAYSLIQMLCMLFFKGRDMQNILGMGKVTGTGYLTTGHEDKGGLFSANIPTDRGVKVLGMEDLWGNVTSYVEGLYVANTGAISWTNENYNELGTDYKPSGLNMTKDINGYVRKVTGTTELPFVPIEASASSGYYSDKVVFNHTLSSSSLFTMGGAPSSPTDAAGLFYCFGYSSTASARSYRMMYLSN